MHLFCLIRQYLWNTFPRVSCRKQPMSNSISCPLTRLDGGRSFHPECPPACHSSQGQTLTGPTRFSPEILPREAQGSCQWADDAGQVVWRGGCRCCLGQGEKGAGRGDAISTGGDPAAEPGEQPVFPAPTPARPVLLPGDPSPRWEPVACPADPLLPPHSGWACTLTG